MFSKLCFIQIQDIALITIILLKYFNYLFNYY